VEDSARETGEATRNAAITASMLMNRDLRIQHAMAGNVGAGNTSVEVNGMIKLDQFV
jgi:hypothetical protein